MPIYKICKSKEDENERKEDRCNHSIDNPEKKVELKSWESLGKVYTPGIHCLFPIPFGFHQEHVLEMKNDQRFQSKNLARNPSPPINHYICNKESRFHRYRYSNVSRYSANKNLLHSICIPESAYLTGWPLVRISFELKLVIIQPILKPISFPDKFGKLVCIIDSLGKRLMRYISYNNLKDIRTELTYQIEQIKETSGTDLRAICIVLQTNRASEAS
nr:Os10g0579150 [Ipomoea batatas]